MTNAQIRDSRLDAISIVQCLHNDQREDAEQLIRTTGDALDLAAALAWLCVAVLNLAGDRETVDMVLRQLRWVALSEEGSS